MGRVATSASGAAPLPTVAVASTVPPANTRSSLQVIGRGALYWQTFGTVDETFVTRAIQIAN